ncbi:hypothetical protein GSUET_05060 [Geobacter sulfurreducens subsp. ethanolicus]|uniref:Uncharacterized protein n=1 Tax=Geomobilimonas luticola TaxID=1114878 RepID=A0ABS5SB53_9BACT|nr:MULTISPECIES: hypothetical protein [Geobacteraceae]MBT0652600.1 hypothetical protein [Geomobilimonas luticola]BEH08894.1 hypothetical protein GSUET_05060 [Geobacter sulfurreducens subsp. ethanolicus]
MRRLESEFMAALKDGGILHPIVNRIQKDRTLDFQIRSNEVHIYYRGGKILGIKPSTNIYICEFDANYDRYKELQLPVFPKKVSSESDSKSIVEAFPQMKQAIDFYFASHKDGSEREFQQLIVRENNYSIVSNATDYFIVDIEYDSMANDKRARFDLLAIKWESDGSHRKNPKKFLPKLAICELKYYTQALSGKAGLMDHVKDVSAFIAKPGNVEQLKIDVLEMFRQKRELGLVDFGVGDNNNPVEHLDNSIELILMLANHDPESTKLKNLEEIPDENGLVVKVAVANFLGYGLYKESVYDLSDFREKYKKQIYCKLTDKDKARQLFQDAGFDLPAIPKELAVRLKKRTDLDFSTREIPTSPNYLQFYVDEAIKNQVDDYVILSRAVNSPTRYAIHYFLVFGPLRMFLQLFWAATYIHHGGDTYVNNDDFEAQIREIRQCFILADQIVTATSACKASDRLTIVCTNDGGSYWEAPDQGPQEEKRYLKRPSEILGEALQWIEKQRGKVM